MTVRIRHEMPGDEPAISDVTTAAFAAVPYSDGAEASIIAGLRADGDLAVSLVATEGTQIVGHIAFSPVTVGQEREGWYGLGPVAVCPERQRRGVGRLLIEAGIARLESLAAKGCVLVGDPAFYHRFGFVGDGRLRFGDLPAAYVQWLAFGAEPEGGEVTFRPAFGA